MSRRTTITIICILVFIFGLFCENYTKQILRKAEATQQTAAVFKVEFINHKCEFCGNKPATWYQFRQRITDKQPTTQYLCEECYAFVNYANKDRPLIPVITVSRSKRK